MALDKAMGALIILAVIMAVVFFLMLGKVKQNMEDFRYLSYFVTYILFTIVPWGLGMLFWYGVVLITG